MGSLTIREPGPVIDAVADDVAARGNALTAGDVGYRYLLRRLADAGRSDVIFAMNHQSEKPGYGYQLAHGATSLTEAWNAIGDRPRTISCSVISSSGSITTSRALASIRPRPLSNAFASPAAGRQSSVGERDARHDSRDGEQPLATLERSLLARDRDPGEHHGARERADSHRHRRQRERAERRASAERVSRSGKRAVFSVESGKWVFSSNCCAE